MSDKVVRGLFIAAGAIVVSCTSGLMGKLASDYRERKRRSRLDETLNKMEAKMATDKQNRRTP
ncbi:hypothetical protein BLX41_08535 [Pseudomonas protegens]|uniref:hypothetical protein n=1 Tax=Pseudomonas protegens TaxID=380021 RepID=UPI000F4BA9CC|nr:hypothetical protein [Pseudomonas protegens]ROL80742.1 hypothetical protein BLX41_08535 [Pseudomonas protegens]